MTGHPNRQRRRVRQPIPLAHPRPRHPTRLHQAGHTTTQRQSRTLTVSTTKNSTGSSTASSSTTPKCSTTNSTNGRNGMNRKCDLRFRKRSEHVPSSRLQPHLTCSAPVSISSGLIQRHPVARRRWQLDGQLWVGNSRIYPYHPNMLAFASNEDRILFVSKVRIPKTTGCSRAVTMT